MLKIIVLFVSIFGLLLQASSLKVASAAGYKKPMMSIVKAYKKSGRDVDIMFGNMKKTISQAKNTDVCLVIGDKNYLSKKSDLDIKKYLKLGEGKLVLAFAKGVDIKSLDDLFKDSISRVAMPHPKKAIYGHATKEYLKHLKNKTELEKKLYVVSTVPQVATYLISKEVDAGFMNLTAALNHKDKIGGYILIDKTLYTSIDIVAATLNKQECTKAIPFIEFLDSQYSKEIFKRSGL